jgi:hypothetical protein
MFLSAGLLKPLIKAPLSDALLTGEKSESFRTLKETLASVV